MSCFKNRLLCGTLLLMLAGTTLVVSAQEPNNTKPAADTKAKTENKETKKRNGKEPTAEQIAETVVTVYVSPAVNPDYARAVMKQVKRTGIERGKTVINVEDGKTEDVTFERRFMYGEKFDKDRVRIDRKTPTVEYALLYKDGQISGILNNTPFTPREETVDELRDAMLHSIDTLLRYKENGAQVSYNGKDKIKNVEVWVLDLVDANKNKTRYYISSTKGRVLWLEYEDTFNGKPAKFKRTFHDYAYVQNTLVPYRSVLFVDDKQHSETRLLTVTYGIKMDDSVFAASA